MWIATIYLNLALIKWKNAQRLVSFISMGDKSNHRISHQQWRGDFTIDHLVMSMCRVFSCVVGRGCLL